MQNEASFKNDITSVESWWRTQSATMALLKHAQRLVDDAEKRIAQQEKRISELESIAASDPLTGLMNRRGFERFFAREHGSILRKQSEGAVFVLIDLDHFKEINDTLGHQAGDACLKRVGEKLSEAIRSVDGAARLGGDEFALLLTQTNPAKAASCVDKIRKILDGMTLEWQGTTRHFSASLGVAAVTTDTSFTNAFDIADTRLYADKNMRKKRA